MLVSNDKAKQELAFSSESHQISDIFQAIQEIKFIFSALNSEENKIDYLCEYLSRRCFNQNIGQINETRKFLTTIEQYAEHGRHFLSKLADRRNASKDLKLKAVLSCLVEYYLWEYDGNEDVHKFPFLMRLYKLDHNLYMLTQQNPVQFIYEALQIMFDHKKASYDVV